MKTLFAMLTVCCVVGWGYAQEALSLPELEAVPLDGPLAVKGGFAGSAIVMALLSLILLSQTRSSNETALVHP